MLIPGDMRDDIIVQKKTIIKDDFGGEAEIFVDNLYLRASVKYNSGNKIVNNEEVFSARSITFSVHYRPITETMRILFNNKKYKILFISEIGHREGLSILTELINE